MEIFFVFCQPDYVNRSWISTACFACGKPLWKSLWRMWKTPSYQQVFRCLEKRPQPVEKLHTALHNGPETWIMSMLRHRVHLIFWKQKLSQKFTFCKICLSLFVASEILLKIFCEKLPTNRPRYHPAQSGNTSPINQI